MARNSKGLHHHYLTSAAADDAAGWVEGISALDESHPATALMLADAPSSHAQAAAGTAPAAAGSSAPPSSSKAAPPPARGDTAPAGAVTSSPGGKDTTAGDKGPPGEGRVASEDAFQSQLEHELDLMALEVGV
jgi:hypothetical protein